MNARLISSVGERAQRDPVKVMGQAVNARSHACEFMQTFFLVTHVTAGEERCENPDACLKRFKRPRLSRHFSSAPRLSRYKMPPQKRAASPAKAMPTKAKASYAQILAEVERTSVPKPGARPPTDVGTCQEGREFLQENAQKANVISLPCGMQYRVIKGSKQKDAPSPKIDTQCDVHYRGCLIDGTEFDTSKKPQNKGKPANFAPNKVIQGWTIAMQLMGEGDKWQVHTNHVCGLPSFSTVSHGDPRHPFAFASMPHPLLRVCVCVRARACTAVRAVGARVRRCGPRQVHRPRRRPHLRDGASQSPRRQQAEAAEASRGAHLHAGSRARGGRRRARGCCRFCGRRR